MGHIIRVTIRTTRPTTRTCAIAPIIGTDAAIRIAFGVLGIGTITDERAREAVRPTAMSLSRDPSSGD